MYIKRTIENLIESMSKEFPVIILCGPRQVGKSTTLQMMNNSMKYVTLDDLDARNLAINDPKYFLEQYGYPLIIDEIQYAPNLLSYIKIIVDNKRLEWLKTNQKNECLYWLTGSQQFSIMKNISESLAGRAGILNLSSLSLNEIKNREDALFVPLLDKLKEKSESRTVTSPKKIFEIIYNGGMPAVVAEGIKRENFFSSYVSTYIERDIKQLANVGKTIEFYNFMRYVAVRTGQEINYASISKEIGVDSKTIKSWISILEASGIVFLLHPYSTNVSSRLIKSPKIYFMDTGLCSWLAKYQDPITLEAGAMSGAIFETFVVSEIIKNFYNHGKNPHDFLYYYRDKDQKEVDLLYIENNTITPLEIKKGMAPNHSNKNFNVLSKFNLPVTIGLTICLTSKLTPISKNCYLCPVDLV